MIKTETDKSFWCFSKRTKKFFFLKKEAKTFVCLFRIVAGCRP